MPTLPELLGEQREHFVQPGKVFRYDRVTNSMIPKDTRSRRPVKQDETKTQSSTSKSPQFLKAGSSRGLPSKPLLIINYGSPPPKKNYLSSTISSSLKTRNKFSVITPKTTTTKKGKT